MRQIDAGAVEWLQKNAVKEGWAEIYFNGCRYGHLTSNIVESLNAWLLNVRDLPIIPLLDTIRVQLMEWFEKRRRLEIAAETVGLGLAFVSTITKNLQDNRIRARRYHFLTSSDTKFEVKSGETNQEYLVDFEQQVCSCHEWEIYGYPCGHAYSVILGRQFLLEDFVQPFYRRDYYRRIYAGIILHPHFSELNSINDNSLPEEAFVDTQSQPRSESVENSANESDPDDELSDLQPPSTRRPVGRPRKHRIRGQSEGGSSGGPSKRIQRCGRCKETGHTVRTCKNAV